MLVNILYLIIGLGLLVWSADKFVSGASQTTRFLGVSPLIIGMVVVGFGTSAPEMLVSASSALDGASGIALGNAYGSNITNIALILGLTALLKPIAVSKAITRRELPVLFFVTALSSYFIMDAFVSRLEAVILLIVFAFYMGFTIWQGRKVNTDSQTFELEGEIMPKKQALFWLVAGLILLMISSKLLVMGAVEIARTLGVSDLVIGLTIVAIGTSLPELASSVLAARRGESDLALGNIVGSNLFNTLAVIGIAGAIQPMQAENEIFSRDMVTMAGLTLLLWLFCWGLGKTSPKINRLHGFILLCCFIGYSLYLLKTAI